MNTLEFKSNITQEDIDNTLMLIKDFDIPKTDCVNLLCSITNILLDLDRETLENWFTFNMDYYDQIKHNKMKQSLNNNVDKPAHYNQGSMEVIDMMEKLYGTEKLMTFCELNAFKYRMRAGYKDSITQDIEKAKFYERKFKELASKLNK